MKSEPPTSDLQARLLAIPKFGAGVGLHRMRALLEDLRASPWMSRLDAIKITGSNGKGSVCAMSAAILRAFGLHTGLYTSPHLYTFHERIAIDGAPISEDDLARALEWYEERAAAYASEHGRDTIGAFEAFTAMAMNHFARMEPAALVIEAGIGGRYDSTRVIPGGVVGLVSVDLEHTELLGDSLELIAYDKADLCSEGGVLVAGQLEADLLRRLESYCALRRITLESVERSCRAHSLVFGPTHMTIDLEICGLRWSDLRIALQGHHQVVNASVAILLVYEWARRHFPGLTLQDLEPAVREGLAAVRWPGRFEQVHSNPDVFIDVGHSPAAVDAYIQTIRAVLAGRRLLLVTGVSYNKAVEPIVRRLVAIADEVICTRAHHKGSAVAEIERIVREAAPGVPTSSAATIEEAMAMALQRAAEQGMTVVVGGGLFLSIEATEALRGRSPQALRFF